MSKHTPGPWDFSWKIQPNGCPTVGHKGLMVCMVAHSAKQEDQRETALANARLIAKSPEMFDALEEAEQVFRTLALEGPSATALELADRYAALLAAIRGTD